MVIDHRHFTPAPELAMFRIARKRQCFHVVFRPIKKVDAFALLCLSVDPDQVPRIAQFFISWDTFNHVIFGAAAGFGFDPFIGKFGQPLRGDLLIGKF